MKKNIIASFFYFFIVLLAFPAIAKTDPVALLQSVSNQMIANLKANKTSLKENPELVYSLARRIIVPHADLTEMSKHVLPPSVWNSASRAQRAEFQSLFSTTLIRTYASAIAAYNDQVVTFYPIRGDYSHQSLVKVNSQITSTEGSPISVVYTMINTGNNWKLFDMTVEGVSMLNSFRSQFADTLSHNNMAELINVLKKHNVDSGSNEG